MKISATSTPEDSLNNPNYKKYIDKKRRIQSKYSPKLFVYNESTFTPTQHRMYKKYLKEIADLILKPKGYYQKFEWDEQKVEEKILKNKKIKWEKMRLQKVKDKKKLNP
jgi:hypothetical protein